MDVRSEKCFGAPHKGELDVWRGIRSEQLFLLQLMWDIKKKPTSFFFLWSSRDSFISANSAWRSETWVSFSDNLTDDMIIY